MISLGLQINWKSTNHTVKYTQNYSTICSFANFTEHRKECKEFKFEKSEIRHEEEKSSSIPKSAAAIASKMLGKLWHEIVTVKLLGRFGILV